MNDYNILCTTEGLIVFGDNSVGQLGLGDNEDRLVPTKLEFFQMSPHRVGNCHSFTTALSLGKDLEILSISCGNSHTIIYTTNGIFVCGDNYYDQLYLGDTKDRKVPTKLEFEYEIISIHCNFSTTIFNTTDGLFISGDVNMYNYVFFNYANNKQKILSKLEFESRNLEIISTHCSGFYTIINATDGLYFFGNANFYCPGLISRDEIMSIKLKFEHEIISIHCGFSHTIINTIDGVFVFGSNDCGQLGLGDVENKKELTKLEFFSSALEIISIHCGGNHTIINTIEGLFVFGRNVYGQLGLGDTKDRKVPIKLEFEHEIKSIHCGLNHTIINTEDGLFVFGSNKHGQLGLGDREDRLVPTKILGNYEIILPNKKQIKSAHSSF